MDKRIIVAQASDLFLHNGIRNTTMDAIAEELHISKRTLYKYFRNKDELLSRCLEKRRMQMLSPHESNQGLIDELIRLYRGMQRIDRERTECLCRELEQHHASVYRQLTEWLLDYAAHCGTLVAAGVSQGYLRKETNRQEVCGAVARYLTHCFPAREPEDSCFSGRSADNLILIFVRGISTVKGWIYLDQKLKENIPLCLS